MPRRKAVEVELLPPEDSQSTRGRKKLVEAEHTIKYSAPVPVTIEETSEDPESDFESSDEIEIEKPRRRTAKNERDELRKKLAQSGATPGSQLKLTIERYLHSDVVDGSGGMFAETEHCTKYVCSESHVTGEDYIDVARRFGPGLYRFTLRMQNKIVTAWDKRISTTPSGPIIQNANPNDPTSPQVIVQSDGQQAVMPSMRDIMKGQKEALKEHLEMTKLMREAYGFAPEQPAQQQPRSEDEILAGAILKQPEIIENVVGNVIKRFGGKGSGDDEPWYAEVVKDAVKSGQLAQVVKTAIDSMFNGFRGLFPGSQNNGQAQMAQTTDAPMGEIQAPTHQMGQASQLGMVQDIQTQPQGSEGQAQAGADASPQQQPTATPEEQTLAIVLNNCSRKVPPQITADQVLKYADLLNDQAPQYSIDGYLEMFAKMPVDAAIEFVKTQPNGEQIASLEWAKDYTEQLQKLIRESLQGGEE